MGLDRVSTFNMHQTTLSNASAVQNKLFQLQQQISSGFKADTYEQLQGQVEQFTLLDNRIARTTQYIQTNQVFSSRLDTTSNTLDSINDAALDIKNLIVSRRSSNTDNLAFQQQLSDRWKTLTAQLNTSFEGRYIFGGTRTDVQPVEQGFPDLLHDGVPDSNYYRGSQQPLSVRLEDDYTMTYDVRADNPAFQNIYAAIATASQADATNSDIDLGKALDFITAGISKLNDLHTSVNATKVTVGQTTDRLNSLSLYWTGVKESIINTDLVSASTEVSNNQAILQASFQTFATLSRLTLTNFLS